MTAESFLQRGIPAKRDCPLSALSSFRIGGTARVAVFPNTREQLLAALDLIRAEKEPFEVVGNASNLLFSDDTFEGTVLFTKHLRAFEFQNDRLIASAGTPLPTLALAAMHRGLSGAEFAQGIPGTLGGGIFMNAGAFGGCMADIAEWSEWYDCESGRVGRFCGAEQRFGTRTSVYEQNARLILLSACLRLSADEPQEICARMEAYRTRRAQTQPLEFPSAGSVFRHPPGTFAGKLIEDCGLKGTRIGGAEISPKHAGFIINRGGATAKDVADLIALIRDRVLRETGYLLECEIRFPGIGRQI